MQKHLTSVSSVCARPPSMVVGCKKRKAAEYAHIPSPSKFPVNFCLCRAFLPSWRCRARPPWKCAPLAGQAALPTAQIRESIIFAGKVKKESLLRGLQLPRRSRSLPLRPPANTCQALVSKVATSSSAGSLVTDMASHSSPWLKIYIKSVGRVLIQVLRLTSLYK